jgi:hypothetical protein
MNEDKLINEVADMVADAELLTSTATAKEIIDLVRGDLRSMKDAPKDGTQILAYHKEGKIFHPVKWRDQTWADCGTEHWSNIWIDDYRQYDCDFSGWVAYPSPPTDKE